MPRAATGTVRKLPSGRYQARLTFPDGMRRSAPSTFVTKRDANAWVRSQMVDVSRGDWKPQSHAGSVSRAFGEYAASWLDKHRVKGRPLAVKTKEHTAPCSTAHLMPTFAPRPLHLITRTEVTAGTSGGARLTVNADQGVVLLSGIMREALDDDLIDTSPVDLPQAERRQARVHEPKPLTLAEFATSPTDAGALAALIQVAFWSGLRWGS